MIKKKTIGQKIKEGAMLAYATCWVHKDYIIMALLIMWMSSSVNMICTKLDQIEKLMQQKEVEYIDCESYYTQLRK